MIFKTCAAIIVTISPAMYLFTVIFGGFGKFGFFIKPCITPTINADIKISNNKISLAYIAYMIINHDKTCNAMTSLDFIYSLSFMQVRE